MTALLFNLMKYTVNLNSELCLFDLPQGPATQAEEDMYKKLTLIEYLLENDDSGDLEFIKHQVKKILSS